MFCFCLWGTTGWRWLHVCPPRPLQGCPSSPCRPGGDAVSPNRGKNSPVLACVFVPPLPLPLPGVRGQGQGVGRAWCCLRGCGFAHAPPPPLPLLWVKLWVTPPPHGAAPHGVGLG